MLGRGGSSWIFFAAICLAIAAAVSESGRDSGACSRTKCRVPASRKFKYEENATYRYRYTVDASTNLGRTEHRRNESTLRLEADLLLRFSGPCEGRLKFENASLSHDPRKYNPEFPDRAGAEFKASLERYAIGFAFDDGRIAELCPDKREPIWVLNAKRGALSMIQNSMHRFDVDYRGIEVDVNGACETVYRLHEARRTSLVVRKSKNLAGCAHGSKHFSVVRSAAYKSPRLDSSGPRHPVLASRSECELTIDRNVYQEIVCRESHRFQPLSSGDTGPRTESTSRLRLIGEARDGEANGYSSEAYSAGSEPESEDDNDADVEEEDGDGGGGEEEGRARPRRTSLLYDYSKTPRTMHGELRSSRDLLKAMCKLGLSSDELQHRFSETFTAFVQSARLLDYPSLSQLFFRANGICRHGRKRIVDALPFMGSNAAVTVMRELIEKRHVDGATIEKWVTAFALIPRPNRDTIATLYPLLSLDRRMPAAQFALGYSATIYAFCSSPEARCENVPEVARFLSYLEEKVEKGCAPRAASLSEIDESLIAMKAIGNMGLETDRLKKLLKECVDDATGFLPMEIRVAAIEAHRRMPSCESTRDLYFLRYYRNASLDAEIRIASYLQAMRCPDYTVVKTIKHALKEEELNQVGTFVWSHLTNLYDSASPTRLEIQSLLTDRDLDDKFNSDRRKFSRNYDGSFFSEEYNFGANYQANLIFSTKSYIPRSATFNLTFDLLGESVNALELTARFEGLEYYAEKFFGPDGPYSNEKVSGFFASVLRRFREAPPEQREDYWERVKRLPNVIDNNFDRPRISFGYKIFGNDLKFTTSNGDREIREALARLNPWERFKEIASGKEIRYENAVMFLDSTYVVPMTSGLPVRLDFAGSAACALNMSGLLDAKGIAKGEVELVADVAPSLSVDVVGSMTVDAFYKTAGTKLRSNLFSSGAVRVHLDAKGTRSVRLSLGLPNKRAEVFSVGTEVLWTKGNGAELEEKPVGVLFAGRDSPRPDPLPSNVISNTSCSWTALDRLIGLKMCLDYQLSNATKDPGAPYFVLTGPTLFRISLHKADPSAKNYLLEYKWEKSEARNIFRLAFDTPGSQINRELSATVSFDAKTRNATVLLRSAGNSLVAEGTYKSTENETFVDVGFDINGTKHLDASLGYATKRFQHGYTVSPQMHLIVNNERIAALSGTIRNAWKNNVSQCDIDLTFRTKKVWSKLVGYIVRRNASLAGDFQLEYQLQKMPKKETLRLETSFSNRSSKTLTHKAAELKLRSTAYPQLNTAIVAWYQQALGHLELHAEVNSKPHLMDDRHKLTAQLIVSYSKMYFQNQDTKASALFAVTKPIQNLDIKIGASHYVTGPESKSSLLIGYGPGKEIGLTVNLIVPRGLAFSLEGHANLTIPNFESMLIDARITERSKRTYDLDLAGTWFSGHSATARGTYSDRSAATALSHSLKLIIKSPSFASDVLLNAKLYRNYSDVRVSLHVEQVERDKYAFVLNHKVASPTTYLSYVEARYNGSVYSVTSDVDTEREIRLELHLDKWRDVRLSLTGTNEESRKGFGAELKWDANRDPALKLAAFFSLERRTALTVPDRLPERNATAVATLTYPGRFLVCSCRVTARRDYDYIVDATIDWNPEQTIGLYVASAYSEEPGRRTIGLESRLVTPFDSWKKTALALRYAQRANEIEASGSLHWRDSQRLVADLRASSEHRDGVREWRAGCGLTSTLHSIASVVANATHKLVGSRLAESRLRVGSAPDKLIEAWSIWYLDKESDGAVHLTGNLHLESPVTRYRRSDARCELRLRPDWNIYGAASLELDRRTYSGKLLGDLGRVTESSLRFNLTTPFDEFSFVRGRFGLSERERHAVAELLLPSGPIGFELLCQLFTPDYDANARLLLATPLEQLRKLLLVAKLNEREADFRIAYNAILVGFQGVWHYRNITDFHYTYRLYTPIAGFEENGATAKLIATRPADGPAELDVEFSVRLSETKAGVRARAGAKSPPVAIGGRAPTSPISGSDSSGSSASSDSLDSFDEEAGELHWRGEFELCPVIFDPVVAELDIDNAGPSYVVSGSLRYFRDAILLEDAFWIEDLFNMKNELNLILPFEFAQEISCANAFLVDLDASNYTLLARVNARRNGSWYETGVDANYAYAESERDDSRTHAIRLALITPLASLEFLRTNGSLTVDENFYRSRIDVRAPDTRIELLGSLETEEAFLDATLVLEIDAPLAKLPRSRLAFKRDYTEKEKYTRISGEIAAPISKSFAFQSDWDVAEERGRASLLLETWLRSLPRIEADLSYANAIAANDSAGFELLVVAARDRRYRLSGNYSGGAIEIGLATPGSEGDGPRYAFRGLARKANDSTHRFTGELRDLATGQTRLVSGTVEFSRNGSLRAIRAAVRPKEADEGSAGREMLLEFQRETNGGAIGKVSSRIVNGTIAASFLNRFNWDARVRADVLGPAGRRDRVRFDAFANAQVNGNASLYVRAETPLEELRNASLSGSALLTNDTGDVRARVSFDDRARFASLRWRLLYMLDMFGRVVAGWEDPGERGGRVVDGKLFFANPGRAFRNLELGFDLDADRGKWKLAANASLGLRNHENVDGVFAVRLPPPDDDDHRFLISYHANGGPKDASYVIGYTAARAQRSYASDGSMRVGSRDIGGHLRASWGMLPVQSVNNLLNVSLDGKEIRLRYSLSTPKFEQQDTLVLLFDYDARQEQERRAITADLYYPASKRIASANVSYESLANVNGTVDADLPLANVSRLGCQFVVFTTLQRNRRYAKLFWPSNTAILESDYGYRSEKLDSDLEGVLHAEIPLSTRHIGHLSYGYRKRPRTTTGHSELTYNGRKIVEGRYDSKSESRAGFERDRVQIAIENACKPIGILYVNQYEYSAGNEGTNYPTVRFRHANVYRLDDRAAFDVVGESRIETTHTGQKVHLKAVHSNKTVQLRTGYEVLPGEFDQTSWLGLADDHWISYRLNILNKTTEDVANQFLLLSVSYPRRNFSLDGSYWISRDEIKSEAKLDWDRDAEARRPRTVGARFAWTNRTEDESAAARQRATFALRHPSFETPARLDLEIRKNDSRDLLNVLLTATYSTDPSKLFALSATLRDESQPPASRRYAYRIAAAHPSRKIELDARGFAHRREAVLFETVNEASYQRSFLASDRGHLNGRLDLLLDELLLQRRHNEAVKLLNLRYRALDHRYTVNGSVVDAPGLNATGAFYLDPREKFTWMMVNYTPDAVESLRMHGRIPDARSAVFDIWRTYEEDYSVSDVSFYLKLNHSRLITSVLRWRPELRNDLIAIAKKAATDAYDGLNSDADYWKQYVKSETASVIGDVWEDARDDMEEFLDDWNNLQELRTDVEELRVYLNDSYNANDFYIKDIVSFAMYAIDELSLRSHIESLPSIVNEVWEMMGESGQAIRNSLLAVIETIKDAAKKMSEVIAAIARGESIARLSGIIEKLLEKYDKFVKDLHVSFIKGIENLWSRISESVSQQWNRFLLLVEPLFVRFVHYVETVVWKASKEIVDFLYDRRNDLMGSPYFDRFSNFTQDVDKLYRDIKGNDIVRNIGKYSRLLAQFLRERYFGYVPFGRELKDVADEIVAELNELRKLPSIRYATEKLEQLYERVCYVYEYLEIRARAESLIRLIHSKLVDASQTALQAESRYRQAKTEFVFDPNEGVMRLEQKLPMSWHSFNRTPEFHEIPEFRAFAEARAYFAASNLTFWSVYRYKPYMDPLTWLPPFKGQAMIVGSRHFVTFDGRHLDFVGPCTYLLARDFPGGSFAVLLEFRARADRVAHKIVLLFERDGLEIDVFDDGIELLSRGSTAAPSPPVLPLELENGTVYVYQAEGVLVVERRPNQLRLECNLGFDFCSLQLSGWYHGKTAGILGTMNHEPMDDGLASDGLVTRDAKAFAESWALERGSAGERCSSEVSPAATPPPVLDAAAKSEEDRLVSDFCQHLFANKSSDFVSCFDVLEPDRYSKMCARSASKAEACTVALSYVQRCAFRDTYLRIPDVCSSCGMMDGSRVAEGQFRKLEADRVPPATDLVFIVEGKECNRGIKENRSIELLVTQLSKELRDRGLLDNRWSLVVFGADGVFDEPRSVVFDGRIFTKNAARFVDYFDHVPVGDGSRDVFAALAFATKLVFRPGVSKTFVLMPCSHCEPQDQTLDYSVLHQVLLEHDVTLHILMDGDFEFEKDRVTKIFYGLDATKSYTKKDARTLTGDVDLRRQAKLSKSALGYCTPLTLEINGTIFSGDKLRFDKPASIKKFASVFAKRVALTARPYPCQNCECTADNNGVSRMECIPCVYPTPISIDYDTFNLNDSLASLQPLNVDYGLLDVDDG